MLQKPTTKLTITIITDKASQNPETRKTFKSV